LAGGAAREILLAFSAVPCYTASHDDIRDDPLAHYPHAQGWRLGPVMRI